MSTQKYQVLTSLDLFPKPPTPVDKEGNPVYFLAASGVFDKIINSNGDTEAVVMDDFVMVVPEWYWQYLEDYITDTKYAVRCLRLQAEGDP